MKRHASIPHWTTTTKKIVAESPFLKLEEHRKEESGTGRHGYFFIVHAPDWVNTIAITEQQEVVLIEQFRHGSDRIELEIPSGIIDEDENPADAAIRELLEESGYERTDKSEFKKIGEVIPNPAFIRNKCYTYLLTNVRLTGDTSFDENENIRVRLIPRREVERLITTGEIQHSLIITAFYWLQLAGY
ncbi:MAG TPA: NUDIX hydrolase [Candidatus Kapabacteria bacterium]|nr:NUDIX hydrolase [Candidatus Kapabacteria bacterium]